MLPKHFVIQFPSNVQSENKLAFFAVERLHAEYDLDMPLPGPVITWCGEAWWRQMKTFSVQLALCTGNLPVTGEFPSYKPVTRRFDAFADLCLKKLLINKRDAGDLGLRCAHYDITVMGCRMLGANPLLASVMAYDPYRRLLYISGKQF